MIYYWGRDGFRDGDGDGARCRGRAGRKSLCLTVGRAVARGMRARGVPLFVLTHTGAGGSLVGICHRLRAERERPEPRQRPRRAERAA